MNYFFERFNENLNEKVANFNALIDAGYGEKLAELIDEVGIENFCAGFDDLCKEAGMDKEAISSSVAERVSDNIRSSHLSSPDPVADKVVKAGKNFSDTGFTSEAPHAQTSQYWQTQHEKKRREFKNALKNYNAVKNLSQPGSDFQAAKRARRRIAKAKAQKKNRIKNNYNNM